MAPAGGAAGVDRAVVDGAIELLEDGRGEGVRIQLGVGQAATGAVAVEPVPDVEGLLEVVLRAARRRTGVGWPSAPCRS